MKVKKRKRNDCRSDENVPDEFFLPTLYTRKVKIRRAIESLDTIEILGQSKLDFGFASATIVSDLTVSRMPKVW